MILLRWAQSGREFDWSDSEQNKLLISTLEIQEITFESSWNGAKKGFMYGFLYRVVASIPVILDSEADGFASLMLLFWCFQKSA